MDVSVKSEIKKLSNLKQNKNLSDEQLEKLAQKNVVLSDLVNSGNFLDDAEKKLAKKIFEAYLEKLDYENFSDLSTLSTLVYNEILSLRVQKSINECTTKDGKAYISDKLLKSHTDLTKEILYLKEKLGINKEQKEDEFSALQLLKKRFHSWIQENRDSCTIAVPFTCQSCGRDDVKMVLLRKIVKDFEAVDHPWFQGRFYINKYLIELVEAGKMTKEDCAKAHQVSVDHINFAIQNKGKIFTSTDEHRLCQLGFRK